MAEPVLSKTVRRFYRSRKGKVIPAEKDPTARMMPGRPGRAKVSDTDEHGRPRKPDYIKWTPFGPSTSMKTMRKVGGKVKGAAKSVGRKVASATAPKTGRKKLTPIVERFRSAPKLKPRRVGTIEESIRLMPYRGAKKK